MTHRFKNAFLVTIFVLGMLAAPASADAATARFWGPMLALPRSARASFSCILWHESRSTFQHLNLGDNNRYGSSGIFQIEQQLWAARSGFRIPVWEATPYQQELGAIQIWRVDGFHPWYSDGCF